MPISSPLRACSFSPLRAAPSSSASSSTWRCVNETSPFNQHVTLGRHIRFVVEGIKPSHTGFFQIHASLNDDIRRETHRPDEPLGVQHPDAQLSIPADDLLDIHNQPTSANADLLPSGETPPAKTVDVFAASRRSSGSRARASAILEDDPFSSNVFGDALSQSPFGTALPPVSTPSPKTGRKKKQKHTSSQRHRSKTVSPKVEARSVKFEQVQVALRHDEANGAAVASAEASQAEASQAEASQAEASQAEASHAEASQAEASQASQAEASQAEASQVGVLTQADVVSQTDVAAQTPSQSSQKRKETKEERRKRREEKRLRKQAKNKAAMEAALFAQIGTQVDRPGKAENREIGSDAAAHTGQGGNPVVVPQPQRRHQYQTPSPDIRSQVFSQLHQQREFSNSLLEASCNQLSQQGTTSWGASPSLGADGLSSHFVRQLNFTVFATVTGRPFSQYSKGRGSIFSGTSPRRCASCSSFS
ncbi:unnamed protein product [Chondrus crispus]|uniref:Uncharacterized protein n=1 Tax=Chondrus crispus TaxID=2769 RepID=R7QDZ7_CHOCR|nr:unnamed protein product [Chondrus crispus]CDF36309.1 unnamed protein product [Chondrus crispus]|eukprot:XP_005716128.1 unnamed protein product [Chondrus crispus]